MAGDFLGTYQKLGPNKTCHLKLMEQIIQAQVIANKGKKEVKVYILLFKCSVSRSIHLETLTNQTGKNSLKHWRE